MSTTLAPTQSAAAAADISSLEARVELIACGVRPGKTQACTDHRGTGAALLNIASTGALDALAATICGTTATTCGTGATTSGTGRGSACTHCITKATEIIRIYNEGAK